MFGVAGALGQAADFGPHALGGRELGAAFATRVDRQTRSQPVPAQCAIARDLTQVVGGARRCDIACDAKSHSVNLLVPFSSLDLAECVGLGEWDMAYII